MTCTQQTLRNANAILRNIDHYLEVRDYMVNELPVIKYDLSNSLLSLITNKLDCLEEDLRGFFVDYHDFRWVDYQFQRTHKEK